MMLRLLIPALALLTLAGCGKQEAKAPEPDPAGAPQIATSIDDYALPVDRSAQITAIDAATGDAAGMPGDGGPVAAREKPAPRQAVEAAAPDANLSATAAPLVPPPPPPSAAMPAAPVPAGD